MIFKTTDNGTAITNIFKEYSKVKNVFEDLSKETTRSVIKGFNNTSLSVEELDKKFGGLDASVADYLNTAKKGDASMLGLKSHIDASSASMGLATLKAKALSMALNALTGLAITVTVQGMVWLFDKLITTLDEQKKKLDEAKSAYEESSSELSSLNEELKTTGERIDELNGKEHLTFTEKDELEKLKATNDELERKIFLLEKANQEAEKEVVDESQNLYNKYTNNRTTDLVGQIDFYSDSSLLEGVNWDNYKNDLSWLVAQYHKQEEILENAQANGWTSIEEKSRENLKLLEGYMADASKGYTDLYETINGISDVSITPDLENAKQDLNEILDIVANILGYGGQEKETDFDSIWDSEDFSKYKNEIIELSKQGKLSPEVLSSNENYKKLLDDTGNSAEETAEHINALVDEMEKVQDSTLDNETPISTISSSIQQISKQLKPQFDELAKAYQDIFKLENGKTIFSLDSVDNDMLEGLRKSFAEIEDDIGVDFDTTGLDNFFNTLSNGESTAEQVQQAFNDLATSYLYSTDTLNNLNDETAESIQKQLEAMGVTNAEEIVTAALTQRKNELAVANAYAAATGNDLANATASEIAEFAAEQVEAGKVNEELVKIYLNKIAANMTTIDTAADIDNLYKLAVQAGATAETLNALLSAKGRFSSTRSSRVDATRARKDAYFALKYGSGIEEETPDVKINFDGNSASSAKKSASKTGKEAADKYLEAFEKELKKLDKLKEYGRITEKQYLDQLRVLYIKYFADKEKYLDQYEEYENKYLTGMKSYYESVFSYISKILSKRISALGDEKSAAVDSLKAQQKAAEENLKAQQKALDEQIKAIQARKDAKQKEIDAINDAADAVDRQKKLEDALYKQKRAQEQKVNKVYAGKDKGFIYEVDQTAIRDAGEEVEDAKRDIRIAAIEKEINALDDFIDRLEAQKDAIDAQIEASNAYFENMIAQTEAYYDNLIENMQKYQDRWDELSELQETAEMRAALEEMGYTEQDILNMSEEAFQNLKMTYLGFLKDMSSGNDIIKNQLSDLSGVNLDEMNGYLTDTKDLFSELSGVDLSTAVNSMDNVETGLKSIKEMAQEAINALTGGGSGEKKEGEKKKEGGKGESGGADNLAGAIEQQGVTANEVFPEEIEQVEAFTQATEDTVESINKIGEGLEQLHGTTIDTYVVNHTIEVGGTERPPIDVPEFKLGGKAHFAGTEGNAYDKGSHGTLLAEHNALVSEFEPEVVIYPDGTYRVFEKPTITDLPKGTRILNGEQTAELLETRNKTPLSLINGNALFEGHKPETIASMQRLSIIENAKNMYGYGYNNIPDFNADNSKRDINISFGDITLPGVKNAEDFANGISTTLHLKVNQLLNTKENRRI